MQETSFSSPCYCRDADKHSVFYCWFFGYHYEQLERFQQHAVSGAARAYAPPPHPFQPAAQANPTVAVVVADRINTETVHTLAGVMGYAEGTDTCLLCRSIDCFFCSCDAGVCLWTLIPLLMFPIVCLAALLCVTWDTSPQAAPVAVKNVPYKLVWFFPFGYYLERKYYMQPGVPPVTKKEVCSLCFCAQEK